MTTIAQPIHISHTYYNGIIEIKFEIHIILQFFHIFLFGVSYNEYMNIFKLINEYGLLKMSLVTCMCRVEFSTYEKLKRNHISKFISIIY